MGVKIKKCKVCQADIASNAKNCPQCGAKNSKPIFKKWWFWVFVVFILIVVLATGGGEEEPTASSEQQGTSSSATVVADDNTPSDSYKWIAENAETPFTISDKSISFMNEHKNFFPGNSDIKGAISDYVDEEITYAHLSKSISKYGDKLIAVYGEVIDIEESEDGSLTYLHIVDYDYNNYTLYYLGTLDDILEGTEVLTYSLPLTMTTFENMQAEYTEAVLGAACYVEEY